MDHHLVVRQFAAGLRAETGLGDVEVEWLETPRGGRWQISWLDGPTVMTMKSIVENLPGRSRRIRQREIAYTRTIRAETVALALIRNVIEDRPPLGPSASLVDFRQALDLRDFPERGTAEDVHLAQALCMLTDGRIDLMPSHLAVHGLAKLREAVLRRSG